jgi:hypothetical protein
MGPRITDADLKKDALLDAFRAWAGCGRTPRLVASSVCASMPGAAPSVCVSRAMPSKCAPEAAPPHPRLKRAHPPRCSGRCSLAGKKPPWPWPCLPSSPLASDISCRALAVQCPSTSLTVKQKVSAFLALGAPSMAAATGFSLSLREPTPAYLRRWRWLGIPPSRASQNIFLHPGQKINIIYTKIVYLPSNLFLLE